MRNPITALAITVALVLAGVAAESRADDARPIPELGVVILGEKVASVTSGSIADKVGVARGDQITRLNGLETPDGKRVQALARVCDWKHVEVVVLEVLRGGQRVELRTGQPAGPPRTTGLDFESVGFLSDKGRHLRVKEVEPGSSWARAGVKRGESIVAIDGRKVNGLESFQSALANAKDPATIELAPASAYTPAASKDQKNRTVTVSWRPVSPVPAATPARTTPTEGFGRSLGKALGGL